MGRRTRTGLPLAVIEDFDDLGARFFRPPILGVTLLPISPWSRLCSIPPVATAMSSASAGDEAITIAFSASCPPKTLPAVVKNFDGGVFEERVGDDAVVLVGLAPFFRSFLVGLLAIFCAISEEFEVEGRECFSLMRLSLIPSTSSNSWESFSTGSASSFGPCIGELFLRVLK